MVNEKVAKMIGGTLIAKFICPFCETHNQILMELPADEEKEFVGEPVEPPAFVECYFCSKLMALDEYSDEPNSEKNTAKGQPVT